MIFACCLVVSAAGKKGTVEYGMDQDPGRNGPRFENPGSLRLYHRFQ